MMQINSEQWVKILKIFGKNSEYTITRQRLYKKYMNRLLYNIKKFNAYLHITNASSKSFKFLGN